MSDVTVKIGDITYRIDRIDSFNQLGIASKLSMVFGQLAVLKKAGRTVDQQAWSQALVYLTSSIPNEDRDYAFDRMLSCVKRQTPGSADYAPIRVGGHMMFEDIGLAEEVALAWAVIERHKILDFFSEPPSFSRG
jgi:hypothetical protein